MKQPKKPMTVFAYFREHIKWLLSQNQPGTARTYTATLKSLKRFRNKSDLKFKQLNTQLVDSYSEWLYKDCGVTRNTVSFYMRVLRACINHAADEDVWEPPVPVSYLFRHVYTGIDKTTKRATRPSVLDALRRLNLSQHRQRGLRLARDIFFFSFYTRGMSFVDIAFLQQENIKDGLITYARHKTGQVLRIEIEPCVNDILARYNSPHRCSPYVFPLIGVNNPSDAYPAYKKAMSLYNKRLERLRRMLNDRYNIHVPHLSSYVARHTWASMARDVNVPINVISQSLGHNSELTTQIYLAEIDNHIIHAANRQIIRQLQEFNEERGIYI